MSAEPDELPLGALQLSLAAAWACPLSGAASLVLLGMFGRRELAGLHRAFDPLASDSDAWAVLPCLGALVGASFLFTLSQTVRTRPELEPGEGRRVFACGALSAFLWPPVLLWSFAG